MENEILRIGMPSGSLASAQRGGNLIKLLDDAGFNTMGYDEGGPTKFKTVNFMYGWDGRPQEFGSQLCIDELDVAISGDDWIRERVIEFEYEYNVEVHLENVLPLKRGKVKLVGIIPGESVHNRIEDYLTEIASKSSIITVVSELPYLALDWMKKKIESANLTSKFSAFSVQKYKTPSKIKSGVVIYETWGKTEAKVKNGGAHLGVEITQSGSSIRSYGLKIVDTVMESQAGVWINPKVKSNPQKLELLKMFLINIYGSLNAENKVLVVFNVPNRYNEVIKEYLIENNLFADEPTMIAGKDYTQFNIQVDAADTHLPISRIRYELAKRQAKNIDTIPILSSIQGIDVLSKLS